MFVDFEAITQKIDSCQPNDENSLSENIKNMKTVDTYSLLLR